jgi:hypothetical protein
MKQTIHSKPQTERMVNIHAQEGKEEGEVTHNTPGHRAPVAGAVFGGAQ